MKIGNRKKIIILLVALLIILITAGTSAALFSYIKEGSTENVVKLGAITFKYTENQNFGNGISISNAMPITDEQGKSQIESGSIFDFKVEANLSRSDLGYEIVAEPTKDSTLPLDAIKFYLTDITSGTEEEVFSTMDNEGNVKTLDMFNDTQVKNAKGKTVYQETILKNTKGYVKHFRARMWLAEEIDWTDEEYMGKKVSIRVNVHANSSMDMASTDVTNPSDTSVVRVTANQKYLFTETPAEDYQYNLTVPNEVDTLDIDVIPNNMDATVTITELSGLAALNSKTDYKVKFLANEIKISNKLFQLKVGENYFKAVVTSSSGVKRQEYILKVIREKSSNTNLENLAISGYTLSPLYSDSENLYELEVPYEATSITVTATKKEEVQTITGLGKYELEIGTNVINVLVTAENGTKRTIQITVNRKKSNDASINNVGVVGYSLTHLENNIYSVTVPYTIESITIENISQTDATVLGIGEKTNLKVGNNDYEVTVTSDSGLVSNKYIIRIVREQDTVNTLKSLSLTNCTLSPTFDKEVLAYSCTVENNVTKTTVSAEATSSVATISGLGEKSLSVGENTLNVVVTAQNGSKKTYTVTVTRKASSDATLKTLTVSNGNLSPNFSSESTSYTVSVPYSIDNITITGTVNNNEASIGGDGIKALVVGENTFDIKVTAGDKTEKIYTIVVTREQDTDTSLKSIGVTGYDIVKVDDNHYTLTVANDVTSVEVTATATSSVAVVTGTGSKTLNVGNNIIKVIVTAQNGDTSAYEIDINRLASSDATLKNLTISNGTLSPIFESETTSYTTTVTYSVTSLTVTPTVNNSEATYTVSGNTGFVVGENIINIVVTAGDGTTKIYTITVTRSKDTDATLNSLSLTDCTLSPTFSSSTTSYTCTVENNITSTTVTATTTSSVATVSGTGSQSLSVGNNTINVTVTAQDGITTKTYTVTVNRKASSDATLKSLTLSSGTLSPTFAKETTSYTATVPYSVTSLTVTPTVNNSEATYTVSGNTGFVVGENTINIVVTAGDGTTKTYTIIVTRSKDSDATLKSLGVTGYSISPTFASGTTSYTLTVEANSLTITASTNSSVATVSGTGSKTLSWGSNELSVIVTAQDGTVKTYKIIVTNQRPTAPTITGGSDSWTSTAPTISVSKAGTAISGVKHYEYYKSTSNTAPIDETEATGTLTTTSSSLTVSDEGTTYIYYRTVSNNGFKSVWTGPQVTNIGTKATTLHYDNSNTGLNCDNVQCALDEIDKILSNQ